MYIEKNIYEFKDQFSRLLGTFIVGAFAFTAALLWRDFIQSLIFVIEPKGETLLTKFYAALIITFLAVIVLTIASKFLKIKEDIKVA